MELRKKGRNVAGMRIVEPDDELMLISKDGIVIRTVVESVRRASRLTEGVTVMKLGKGDKVSSISTVGYDTKNGKPEDEEEA